MCWNQHDMGHQPCFKKVKNLKESKLEFFRFWLELAYFQQNLENRKIR